MVTTEQSGGTSETGTGRTTRKGPSAFRTIGEASDELNVPQHVLRFWETKFTQLKPLKRAGARRYYRPEDMELLTRIRDLLYQEGFTIKGAKRSLSQKGGAKTASKMEEPAAEASEATEAPDAAAAPAEGVSPEAEKAEAPPAAAEAVPAPLFDRAPATGEDTKEAQRLRVALQEIHRDLSLLRRQISERASPPVAEGRARQPGRPPAVGLRSIDS